MKCPNCKGTKLQKKGIRAGKQRYRCTECRASFTEGKKYKPSPHYPQISDYKEKIVSLILKGKSPAAVAEEYNYSFDHLRKVMLPYYKNEKITAEQKKNIIRYGYYLNVPVNYMAEYIKCSEHKCKEVLQKFKKSIMSTNRDAIE